MSMEQGLGLLSVIYFFVNFWEGTTSKPDLERYVQSLISIGFSGEVLIAYSLEAVSPSHLKDAIEKKCLSCPQVHPPFDIPIQYLT